MCEQPLKQEHTALSTGVRPAKMKVSLSERFCCIFLRKILLHILIRKDCVASLSGFLNILSQREIFFDVFDNGTYLFLAVFDI